MELADAAFSEMSVKLEAALRTAESFRQRSLDLAAELAALSLRCGRLEKVVEAAREYSVADSYCDCDGWCEHLDASWEKLRDALAALDANDTRGEGPQPGAATP